MPELIEHPEVGGWKEWEVVGSDASIEELMDDMVQIYPDFYSVGRVYAIARPNGGVGLFVGMDVRT
jgi:hypothetical protein